MTAATNTSETATRFAQSIATLPPLPATAQQILTCFGDEFIDADKVTEVVEGDPGICAKLLGLANSAYFGLAEPVNSIGEAISRVLGVDTVRSLVLAMAIQQSFNNKGCPSFKTDRFWMQSLLSAECCKKIAAADEAADDAVRDLAYSAGLCHNLGLMALVHMEPARVNNVLAAHQQQS
ncbi:MAG: HDOD domain-containing protein, partial [Gammaproteobacteria bacterium]|nr:HDOD domain-containing protein [Gammaproteobacteria bacterium]